MASKKPIIAANVPSISNIVDKNCVFLFEPDSSKSLAKQIIDLEKNPDNSKKIISNAYKKVITYSWDERCKKINKLISDKNKFN